MTLRATVLIPTHDHGPTLVPTVGTALGQTISDIEVFIVGDGAPDITRDVVADLKRRDERIRFFDNPKGPRHGEVHRHAALAEARGEIVCYLSDDDLWFPDHVKTLSHLLASADFAHALPIAVEPDGSLVGWTVDLSLPFFPDLLLSGDNRIPLSCGAHTLEMYRRLPAGWRTTPEGIHTDLYMWQQFLAQPGCRAVSGTRPTVLHFPSPWRRGWSRNERVEELDHWARRLADPEWRERFIPKVVDHLVRHRAQQEDKLQAEINQLKGTLSSTETIYIAEINQLKGALSSMEDVLRSVTGTVTWKLRDRLVRMPWVSGLLRGLLRSVARVLAGPRDR